MFMWEMDNRMVILVLAEHSQGIWGVQRHWDFPEIKTEVHPLLVVHDLPLHFCSHPLHSHSHLGKVLLYNGLCGSKKKATCVQGSCVMCNAHDQGPWIHVVFFLLSQNPLCSKTFSFYLFLWFFHLLLWPFPLRPPLDLLYVALVVAYRELCCEKSHSQEFLLLPYFGKNILCFGYIYLFSHSR